MITMDGDQFSIDLARHLETVPLLGPLKSELDLERMLRAATRDFTGKYLNLRPQDFASVVYSHGENGIEKMAWSRSKALQNVVVFGCSNTSDIFVTHSQIGSIYIEVKLSKARGRGASSLPGDLQRSIGQCVIASLRHAHVICFVGVQAELRQMAEDLSAALKTTLLEKHRIVLLVRPITPAPFKG